MAYNDPSVQFLEARIVFLEAAVMRLTTEVAQLRSDLLQRPDLASPAPRSSETPPLPMGAAS